MNIRLVAKNCLQIIGFILEVNTVAHVERQSASSCAEFSEQSLKLLLLMLNVSSSHLYPKRMTINKNKTHTFATTIHNCLVIEITIGHIFSSKVCVIQKQKWTLINWNEYKTGPKSCLKM